MNESNELKVSCPHCGQHIAYTEAWAGHQIQCPTCQGSMNIPASPVRRVTFTPPPGRPPNVPAPGNTPAMASAAPVASRSKLAIASMVSSLVLCLAPFSSIAGIICGHMARRELRSNPALRGAGFATTGLIVGYIATGITVASLILFLLLPGAMLLFAPSLMTAADTTSVSNAPNASSAPAPTPEPAAGSARPTSSFDESSKKATRRVTPSPGSTRGAAQPATPVTGKIGGREFKCEAATLSGGWLTLRQGKDFLADAEIKVVLFSSNAALEGKKIVADPSSRAGNPHIHFNWKDGSGNRQMDVTMNGYTMTLEFGKAVNGVIPGHIELEFGGAKPISVKGDFAALMK